MESELSLSLSDSESEPKLESESLELLSDEELFLGAILFCGVLDLFDSFDSLVPVGALHSPRKLVVVSAFIVDAVFVVAGTVPPAVATALGKAMLLS